MIGIFAIGDSKTAGSDSFHVAATPPFNTWPRDLAGALNAITLPATQYFVTNVGVGGATSTDWRNNIDATLAAQRTNHQIVFYQIGVNEFGSISENTWVSNVEYALDAMHVRWPGARMFLSYPWKCQPDSGGNCTADATADQFATWVDRVVSERSSFVFAGDDERVWFKPNIATYSDDVGNEKGLHFYPAAGQAAKVQQMKTLLGY